MVAEFSAVMVGMVVVQKIVMEGHAESQFLLHHFSLPVFC